MKKRYVVPVTETVSLVQQGSLLAGSSNVLENGEVGAPDMMPMTPEELQNQVFSDIVGFPV